MATEDLDEIRRSRHWARIASPTVFQLPVLVCLAGVGPVTAGVWGRAEEVQLTPAGSGKHTVTPLFDTLAAFHLAHPNVEITLVEDSSDRLIDSVRTGTTDLALIGAAGTPPVGLDSLPIISERLVAAVPVRHPLAKRRQTTLVDISAHPIVCLPRGTGIRTVFDQACAAKGIQPDIALQASAPDAVADLAIRGLGIAILSQSMAAHHNPRLTALVIDDITTPAVLALVWKSTQSPALRELLTHARDAFTNPQPRQELPAGDREAR